jgi:hypothetical protein
MDLKKILISMTALVSVNAFSNEYVSIISKGDVDYTHEEVSTPTPPVENYITIPAMTGYTNAYGTSISSTEYNRGDYYPNWNAFDGKNSSWHGDSFLTEAFSKTNEWVGFHFNESRKVKQFHFYRSYAYPFGTAKNVVVQYSDDGSSWTDASANFLTDINHVNVQYIPVLETGSHTYWRLFMKDNHENTVYTPKADEYPQPSSYFIAVGDINIEFTE